RITTHEDARTTQRLLYMRMEADPGRRRSEEARPEMFHGCCDSSKELSPGSFLMSRYGRRYRPAPRRVDHRDARPALWSSSGGMMTARPDSRFTGCGERSLISTRPIGRSAPIPHPYSAHGTH